MQVSEYIHNTTKERRHMLQVMTVHSHQDILSKNQGLAMVTASDGKAYARYFMKPTTDTINQFVLSCLIDPDPRSEILERPGNWKKCFDKTEHPHYEPQRRPPFVAAPSPRTTLDFSDALVLIKKGKRVARTGWNGNLGHATPRMFIFLVAGSQFQVNRAPLNEFYSEGTPINYLPHVDMRTADGSIVPWLCSQTDMLATDWELLA
jgi:hypothetical protein